MVCQRWVPSGGVGGGAERMNYTITLPFAPSVNSYWRQWQGRTLLSAKGREYKQAVALRVLQQGRKCFGSAARLAIDIHANPPDRRQRDIDNLPKSILDSLAAAGVFGNDEQVDDLRIRRGKIGKPGSGVVTITEIAA